LISWKYSFEEISKDLELTKKKKLALDGLLEEGKISQSTYESLNKELTDTIVEIEARRTALAGKITSKISELEQQTTVLEMFLANSEIGYAAGEIDEDLHQRETNAFALGLEATKQELNTIKESLGDLTPEEPVTMPPSPPVEVTEEAEIEELVEVQPEIVAEEAVEPEVVAEEPPEPETISEELVTEESGETPAEEVFVEEAVEVVHEELPETPSEVSPEEFSEEAPVEEEKSHQPEEVVEESVEEIVESSEVTDEIAVEEAPVEEEAATEEEEYWE
jgi:hypothetical protein